MNEIYDKMLSKYDTSTKDRKKNAIYEVNQQIVLSGLYDGGFFQNAAFYGGTCLRIFYDLNRNTIIPASGRYISSLESLFLSVFYSSGLCPYIETDFHFSELAAKSIFRFGNLSRAKDIKTTEYVLIGTLTSFTLTILIGFCLMGWF